MRIFIIILVLLAIVAPAQATRFIVPKDQKPEILKTFDSETTTETYMKLPLDQKVVLIEYLIEKYRKSGLVIGKSPTYYITTIYNLVRKNPQLLDYSFKSIFMSVCEGERKFNKK